MNKDGTSREFMTTWHTSSRPPVEAWSDRVKANLIESTICSRHVPLFRPFDLLAEANQALTLLSNSDHRIGVESVCGARPDFVRHVDFDSVYFQFCGSTSFETEYGEYSTSPGELLFIPEGIAHRSTGTADSLRWFAFVSAPFREFMTEADYTGETEFTVTRRGGPNWTVPAGADRPVKSGRVKERMVCWEDGPDDFTLAERDYAGLADVSSTAIKEKASGIRKLRVFDIFKGIAGKTGGVNPMFRSPHLEIKTYNIGGEQFAFHRALRTEEVRIQFRGQALDMSEVQNAHMSPGAVTIVPRGIAHSVITDPPEDETFLRLNFYSDLRWSYPVDLTKHVFDSSFEIKTMVHRPASWRAAAE